MRNAILILVAAALVQGADQSRRAIEYEDLPPSVREWLRNKVDAENFTSHVREIDQQSGNRLVAGEREHLIYFILQSTRFTNQPPIEPAQNAVAFFSGLTPEERTSLLNDPSKVPAIERLPARAARRFKAFFAAIRERPDDERVAHFAGLLPTDGGESAESFVFRAYAGAMQFLYQKEFSGNRGAAVELYQKRGFSTDSGFDANFAVDLALSILARVEPRERLHRILIVGPGLDLAPRTDLVDVFPPQSYQPFAVADSVLRLGLTDRASVSVHCVDINDAVLSYLDQVRERQVTELSVLSGLTDTSTQPLSDDYRRYFREFGARIGRPLPRPRPGGRHENRLFKSLRIDEAIAQRITADRLNIITERYVSPHKYDLVIVTNVFPYFADIELALALGNIAAMLRDGGYLVHNEGRALLPVLAGASGLKLLQMRSLVIAPHDRTAVRDAVWIHRKNPPPLQRFNPT
jgi:hypothetical protein